MTDGEKNRIKFRYIFDKQYQPRYVNGAYGGINSRGEIVVNFFMERGPLPRYEVYEINDNQLGDLSESDPSDHDKTLIRFVDTGVILTLNGAEQIRNWLDAHIQNLKERTKK